MKVKSVLGSYVDQVLNKKVYRVLLDNKNHTATVYFHGKYVLQVDKRYPHNVFSLPEQSDKDMLTKLPYFQIDPNIEKALYDAVAEQMIRDVTFKGLYAVERLEYYLIIAHAKMYPINPLFTPCQLSFYGKAHEKLKAMYYAAHSKDEGGYVAYNELKDMVEKFHRFLDKSSNELSIIIL